MTRFLLIRHAATDALGFKLSGRTAGVSLNGKGIAQAASLAQRLRHLELHAIYASPLTRATATAAPIAEMLQLSVTVIGAFQELDFGDWTNQTFEELGQDGGFGLFNSFRSNTRIPGGETMLEAQVRFLSGIEALCKQHPDQTVAIVSHADMIKSAIAHFAGMHLDLMQRISIDPASVSVVEVYPETARITLLNHTGELLQDA